MRKGELRKDAIVQTAQALFFAKGYEETSLQDILDALAISKGGFYHYFESKEALLEEICARKCFADIERVRMEIQSGRLNPTQKLNLLLAAQQLFLRSEPSYAALVLNACYLKEDIRFREHIRKVKTALLLPLMEEVLREGVAKDLFFARHRGHLPSIVLMLGFDVNDEVCRVLAAQAENPDSVIEIVEILDSYRDCVETLIGAQFGSVELCDVEQLLEAYRQTTRELNHLKEKAK